MPGDDPFYRAPAGIAHLALGTVLRSRAVEVALFGVVPQKVSAWQLLYRTTDLHGAPQVAVTTVLLPWDTDPTAARPLLSYQCAIDAVAARCFPSYALRRGARALGAVPPWELLLLAGVLARGWAVSIPDHEGTDGHWGAPREPGYCTLDGIRAALNFAPLGLEASIPVGLWGYSGGGLATSWAAEMAAEYAPELNLVGAALGSPVGDPASAFTRLNATLHAGLPALFVAGLRRVYPELERTTRRHVNADGLARLASIEQMTTTAAVVRLARHDLDKYTDIPLADLLAQPEMLRVFDDIQPGQHAPSAPLFVVQAVHDEIINIDDVDGQVQRYVTAGAHVTYRRDRLSEHLSLHPLATPVTLNWLADRFAGKALPEPDTRTVWSVALSAVALRGLLGLTWQAGKVLLGRPLRAAKRPGPNGRR